MQSNEVLLKDYDYNVKILHEFNIKGSCNSTLVVAVVVVVVVYTN